MNTELPKSILLSPALDERTASDRRLPAPSLLWRHEDACGDEVGPPTPYYSQAQMRALLARQDSLLYRAQEALRDAGTSTCNWGEWARVLAAIEAELAAKEQP